VIGVQPTRLEPARTIESPLPRSLGTAGNPWTPDGFRVSWRKSCIKADIEGVTFHDLRGTAVTRLAIAGATEAEIATLTGHSRATSEQSLIQII
jgi:integrase